MRWLWMSLLLAGLGCDKGDVNQLFPTIDRVVEDVYYVQDTRTGLCFAYYNDHFAGVACTAEVERIMAEQRKYLPMRRP